MRGFAIVGILGGLLAAALPPLTWENYVGIASLAACSFFLGLDTYERWHSR